MPLTNLLVAFNGSDASEAALRYAASLARHRNAHVTALLAHSKHDVLDTTSRWIPREARALLAKAKAGLLTEIEARFEALRAELDLGDSLSFRSQAGRVDAVLAEVARAFDLIIVGRPMQGDDEHVLIHPDRLALMSGRPVVVVPEGYDAEARHSHAALAWDGGRAAARALSDGLALLEAEGRVSVLTVGTPQGGSVDDVLMHLKRHKVSAVHESWPDGDLIAASLLAYCKERDPSILVMGAYEHSKFREDFIGGVTARVMRDIRIPVLLSH